jgi:hypothetical protein
LLFTFNQNFLDAYPAGWSDDILLTPEDPRVRVYPDIDVDGYGNSWVVWDSGIGYRTGVLYSKWDSLGNCVIPESFLTSDSTYPFNQKIVIDGSNNIHIVWREIRLSPEGEIGLGYAKLANDGSIIVNAHFVESGNGGEELEIAINRDKEINIIWDDGDTLQDTLNAYNVMNYTKLDSMGNVLIHKFRVSPDSINAWWPGIGVDRLGNVHLGYRTNRYSLDSLTYTKLDRNGNVLISNRVYDAGTCPSIVADSELNIHMVYDHRSFYSTDVSYLKIDTSGNLLITPRQISPDNNMYPRMAIDSLNYLHVVWKQPNAQCLVYTKIDLLGNFIIPPLRVVFTPPASHPDLPRIAVDQKNLPRLVWMDQRYGPEDVYYKYGENNFGVIETKNSNNYINNLYVIPNPFTSFTQAPNYEKEDFNLCDVSGRMVGKYKSAKIGENLPAGVYFIIPQDRALNPVRIVKIR